MYRNQRTVIESAASLLCRKANEDMNYWLMKTEPAVFGIADLKARRDQTEHWDGVRNYEARNLMRDRMRPGDQAFLYHSSCAEPGIAGIVSISRAAYPDFTAWDPTSDHYDARSTPERPLWYMVDVRFEREFPRVISLKELKSEPRLQGMRVLRRGNRLSITEVVPEEWHLILGLLD